MAHRRFRCWLITPDGCRIHVEDDGLLLGRGPACHLHVPLTNVSRTQALVLLTLAGPVLYNLGRNPTRVQGKAVAESVALKHQDVISIAEIDVRVDVEAHPLEQAPPQWLLEGDARLAIRIQGFPFFIGGAVQDDLVVAAWPPSAMRLKDQGDGLVAELAVPARVNGQALPAGTAALRKDDHVEIGGKALHVRSIPLDEGASAPTSPSSQMLEVRLTRFPDRGGLLALYHRDGAWSVFLPERRCDLMEILLERAGVYVTDGEIMRRVWPREPDKTRGDVNVLLHRLRGDLEKAGVESGALERAPGGGALRFALAAGVAVTVE